MWPNKASSHFLCLALLFSSSLGVCQFSAAWYTHVFFDLYTQALHRKQKKHSGTFRVMLRKCTLACFTTNKQTHNCHFSLSLLFQPLPWLSHSPRLGSIKSGFHSALPPPPWWAAICHSAFIVINHHHHRYYPDSSTSKAPSKPPHRGKLSHGIKIWFWCFHVQQQTTKMAVFNLAFIFIPVWVICCLKRDAQVMLGHMS